MTGTPRRRESSDTCISSKNTSPNSRSMTDGMYNLSPSGLPASCAAMSPPVTSPATVTVSPKKSFLTGVHADVSAEFCRDLVGAAADERIRAHAGRDRTRARPPRTLGQPLREFAQKAGDEPHAVLDLRKVLVRLVRRHLAAADGIEFVGGKHVPRALIGQKSGLQRLDRVDDGGGARRRDRG